jgi:hypothetical protein
VPAKPSKGEKRRGLRFPGFPQPSAPPPVATAGAAAALSTVASTPVAAPPAAAATSATAPVRARSRSRRNAKNANFFTNLMAEVAALPPRTQLISAGIIAALLMLLIVHPWTLFSSSPSGAQAAQPTPASKNAVLTNFFRTVRDPAAAFVVAVNGTVHVNAAGKESSSTVGGNLQVKGDDLSGALQLAGTGTTFKGSIVRVGTASWAKPDGQTAWHLQQLPGSVESLNPFPWIATVDDVKYDAPGPGQGGMRTDLLSSTKWLSGTQYDALVLTLTDVERDSHLQVEATDAGVPLHATYQFSIRGRMLSGGKTLLLSGTINYVFSQWGTAIAINPPV